MEEQQTPAKRWKFTLSALWVVSTIVLCIIFAVSLTPRVEAQGRGSETSLTYHIAIIRNVFEFIQRHYIDDIDPNVLFEGAMSGMLNSLGDPYSAFLPESEMNDLNDTTQGSFGGIGLFVSKPTTPRPDGRPNFLEVASPIEDTPGWRAGINAGDLIIRIDDESTDVLTSDEAVARLRGPPGTNVRLIIRRGEMLEFPITLTRAIIEVPTVKHEMIGDLGYLRLMSFTPMTVERSREAIRDFESRGYKGIILDLRNNYGGLLQSAVGVSNLFFEGGVVVSIKSRIPTENQVFHARGRAAIAPNIPVVVLINRGSASASEIVAGALKDRGRAYLVGEKTFGKGSVQQVFPIERAGFKITTARYFTPSDVNIDKIGIPPDREIRLPEIVEEDAAKLNSLMNTARIPEFVLGNPNAQAVESYAQTLSRDFDLDISIIKRLIRNEQIRRAMAPAYDLEYDTQLIEAVKILREENFTNLMQNTKTLKILQEEALLDDDLLLAS